MIKPFIQYRNCVDEYADGCTIGVFIGTWLLIGWQFYSHDGIWMTGPVLFNLSVGLWNG